MGVRKTETVVAPALTSGAARLQEAIRSSAGDVVKGIAGSGVAVVAVGGATQSDVGDPIVPPSTGVLEVHAPAGIVAHDVADMTVTVGAGTPCVEVGALLAAASQECVLDARSPEATVGGLLASGLSGFRRLRYGPLRDSVLEVRFVTGDGRLVQGGGPTVKNVSGYDLPRLLVGSLGTLGVIVQVTLRCRPVAESADWFASAAHPTDLRAALFAPSALLWDGLRTHVLLEGHPVDIAEQASSAGLSASGRAPVWPSGPHRGRASVPPGSLADLAERLDAINDCTWLAEVGVGTTHVACVSEAALAEARSAAHACGGWLLREAGAPGLPGFGGVLPGIAVMRRIKDAFDPAGILAPGRLPL